MFRALKERAVQPELMDDFSSGGNELHEALRHLRVLNHIFGAASPTRYGIHRLWILAGRPRSLTIMDIGAGSGDVNAALLRWAAANGIDLTITLVDITEEACREASRFYRNEPRVRVTRGDLFALPPDRADIVTGTQFVHHFTDAELPNVIRCMLNVSRLGVVINDIHRHWLPWAVVRLTTRIISNNRYILHDGPLSVAKGFRKKDWSRIRDALQGAADMAYSWRPLFRYAVILQKTVRRRIQ
ncbi:methyltransferase domain-containing protein [Paenibacillus oenotherae]|uniref:Methyltransferase domain-containing protein n=1 Tax=Paenibacillus oenotherae TaxID=1435645 RepID=A0ABS7DAX0_9BACL|nr:methyltransferase domain-containing protein [Paenibacillus oenotherae]MBW7477095.1 methyltransferase domain-containing protein [Paenibacillus oenotherae]